MKQAGLCGWCKKTDELIPMHQGGTVHTICKSCGSTGPMANINEFAAWYAKKDNKLRCAVEALTFIAEQDKPGNWAVERAKTALKELSDFD